MGFLVDKPDGTQVRVSLYTAENGDVLLVDKAGNLYDQAPAGAAGVRPLGRSVSSSNYDSTGDSAGGGSADTIAEVVLADDAPSIALDGLDLSGWKQVRLFSVLRSVLGADGSGDYCRAFLQFNDDAAAHYIWAVQNHDATTANNTDVGFVNGIEAGHMTGPNKPGAMWGHNVYDIIDPGSETANKNVLWLGGIPSGTAALASYGAGFFNSTDPISKIAIVGNDGGDILAGSSLALVGIA